MAICRRIAGGFVALGITTLAAHASATAISQVGRGFFSVHPSYGYIGDTDIGSWQNPISGVMSSFVSQTVTTAVTAWGASSVNFGTPLAGPTVNPSDFRVSIGGQAVANPDGYVLAEYSLSVTLAFTNLTGLDFDAFVIRTWFSDFDHTGDPIGAIVDNTALEFARFSSSVSGPGIGGGHSCDTRLPSSPTNNTYPQVAPAHACGVHTPDSSNNEFVLIDFDNGETQTRTFTLRYTLEAQSVPEPGTIALLGAALLGFAGLGAMSGRTASQRETPPCRA